ncbi:uncharacterized protein METZ01_LOCUS287474, partial [marine metagenome]
VELTYTKSKFYTVNLKMNNFMDKYPYKNKIIDNAG